MKTKIINYLPPSLTRCTRGATIVEFAIVAPVLFLLIMGILEFGLIFFTTTVLEGATNVGARIGKTGYTAAGSREDYIRSEIVRLSGGYLDPDLIDIRILSYDAFDNVSQPEPCLTDKCRDSDGAPGVDYVDVNGNSSWDSDMGVAGAGAAGAVVLYRVTYPWKLVTPLFSTMIGDHRGNFDITAIATVRNEPF